MDMALGAALLLNIRLPRNFNSPYKAVNIQDFWKRWHITLGRFLKEHVYIPLGGNRRGHGRVLANLLLTFIIGGIWHGAGWTFVVWGTLHGIAIVVHRIYKNAGLRLNRWVAWFLTFNFVNASWVFFRARDWEHALHVLKGMVGMGKGVSGSGFKDDIMLFEVFDAESLFALSEIHFILLLLLFICLYYANSFQRTERFRPDFSSWAFTVILGFFSFMYMDRIREFLYFQF
jgi:D-alanyl-lipoteichoic acid acyltransferase DltB (MBOAT superfamily)